MVNVGSTTAHHAIHHVVSMMIDSLPVNALIIVMAHVEMEPVGAMDVLEAAMDVTTASIVLVEIIAGIILMGFVAKRERKHLNVVHSKVAMVTQRSTQTNGTRHIMT